MDVAALLNDYGFPTVVILLLLSNAKNIMDGAERLLCKILPSVAERRRLKLERAMAADERAAEQQRLKLERIAAADERIDTILALKEMLLAYRQRLDDSDMERRQREDKLYELVGLYHKRDAQMIEVWRDVGDALRSQTRRLDRITVKLGMYNNKEVNSGSKGGD